MLHIMTFPPASCHFPTPSDPQIILSAPLSETLKSMLFADCVTSSFKPLQDSM
jgi:hypothetical protein